MYIQKHLIIHSCFDKYLSAHSFQLTEYRLDCNSG